MADYLTRYKEIISELGIKGNEMCELFGFTYSSYKSMTRKGSVVVPKWVKGFVIGYEMRGEFSEKTTASQFSCNNCSCKK